MAIIQRKSKHAGNRYAVRVRDPHGRWYPAKTFQRRTDAEAYERQLLTKRDTGGVARTQEQRQLTVAEYWVQWASQCRNRVSEGWRRSQDDIARKYILPAIGTSRLSELRPQDVGQLLNQLSEKGLAPQSVIHIYNVLHKMCEDACEYFEIIDQNPVRKRFRPKLHNKERNFLSPEDSWKLLEAARNHRLGAAVWISMLAGLRPGEVQALKWSSIDFERKQILIRATFNKKIRKYQDHPKQKDWGKAPMPDALADFLRPRKRGPDDWVVPNHLNQMFSYESLAVRALPRLCKEAGVARITPHELRHSCTELYVQAGASAEDLRRLLNHKSLSATAKYMHRTDQRLQGIAQEVKPAYTNCSHVDNSEQKPSNVIALKRWK